MTPAEQAIAAQALVDRLMPVIGGEPHPVVLAAVLTIFRSTAIQNPCCLESAAIQSSVVLADLRRRLIQPAPAAHIH